MRFESWGFNWTRHALRLFMNKLQEKMLSMDESGGIPEKTRPYKEKKWYRARLYFLVKQEINHYSKLSREINVSHLMDSVLNYFNQFRSYLVYYFKHMFLVFKQYCIYFNTFFYLHVFSKKIKNYCLNTRTKQTLNSHDSWVNNYFLRIRIIKQLKEHHHKLSFSKGNSSSCPLELMKF